MTLASRTILFWVSLATVLITLLCWIFPLDLWLSGLFYAGPGAPERFPLGHAVPVQLIYHLIPVLTAVTAGLLGLMLIGPCMPMRWRHCWILLAFTLALGPGLIVNAVMKPWWGHPRPVAVVEFGGTQDYVPPPLPGAAVRARGFPSGHAASAAASLALLFVWRRQRWLWLLSLGLIGLTAAGRLVAGGHFFSDLWWGVYLTYLCAWLASHGNRRWRWQRLLNSPQHHWRQRTVGLLLVLATIANLPLDHLLGATAAANQLLREESAIVIPFTVTTPRQERTKNDGHIATTAQPVTP
ncbi:MAG: phosphatase PAP2 family protein [Gammaproteobacteria bacterium]|nr:phosphatase PAP2 family protein [Gammaproteobacteria bacterium]